MASLDTYNSTVAARTRAADQILRTPDLLASYEERGGLKEDLKEIVARGQEAELLSHAQSAAQAQMGGATRTGLEDFVALQKEYAAVMAIVQAVRNDLERQGADAELLAAVDHIIVNEADLVIRTLSAKTEGEKPSKKAIRSLAQEAVRAEIQKDAAALLDLKGAHAALAKRKVDQPRLKKLKEAAVALSGTLAEKSVKKGARKEATKAVHEAVTAQKKTWAACYRLLAAVGHEDERVQQLLAAAARKR